MVAVACWYVVVSRLAAEEGCHAIITGYESGCIALEVSRKHPWPVALAAGDNLEDLKEPADVKQHADNGHCESAEESRDSHIWRTRRLRRVVVNNEDQRRVSVREVPPGVVASELVDRGRKRKWRPSTARIRASVKKPRLCSYGAQYTVIEYCVSYYGNNSESWVSEQYIKPVTEQRLAEMKHWLTPAGRGELKFEEALKMEFLQAVAEALFVLLRGWLPPSPRLCFGQFVLVRHGAEPPHPAIVDNPYAAQKYSDRTPHRAAEFIERVEVTYFTRDEKVHVGDVSKAKEGGSVETANDSVVQKGDSGGVASGSDVVVSDVGANYVPTLRRKLPRHCVSDFDIANLRMIGVHVYNQYYSALKGNIQRLRSASGDG